jgi:hypothetical protein
MLHFGIAYGLHRARKKQPTVNVGGVTDDYSEVMYPSRRVYSRLGRVIELVYPCGCIYGWDGYIELVYT